VWFSQLNVIPLRYYEDTNMPANTRKGAKPQDNLKGDWRGFVNVELNNEEWANIDKELSAKDVSARIPAHLDYLLELGKVTFNYTNGTVVCALTIVEGQNKGFTVSSFSDNIVEALLATRLKVQNYLPEFENIFNAGGKKGKRG
jgi:hypothetical protein